MSMEEVIEEEVIEDKVLLTVRDWNGVKSDEKAKKGTKGRVWWKKAKTLV